MTLLVASFQISTQVSEAANDFTGIISASGPFRLDGNLTAGGATLFPGSMIDTSRSPVRIRLKSGANVEIAPQSRALIFADRAQVKRGSVLVGSAVPFDIEASTLHVRMGDRRSSGAVSVTGNTVQVSMYSGAATVRQGRGVTVGRVAPQTSLAFTVPAADASAGATVTGRLVMSDASFQLVDEVSQVPLTLQGAGLGAFSGQRVRVSGSLMDGTYGSDLQMLAVNRIAPLLPKAQSPESGALTGGLEIIIEEGDQAVNDIKQRVAREVVVKVQDENHKPVSGATVSLLLPRSGASGQFVGGGQTLSLQTDADGRALAKFVPNHTAGSMKIEVRAEAGTRKAFHVLSQANVAPAAAAAAGLTVAATTLIAGVTVAAVVVPPVYLAETNTSAKPILLSPQP